MTTDHKLPTPSTRSARRAEPNQWLQADKRDKMKTVAPLALVAVMLSAGLWLIIRAVAA